MGEMGQIVHSFIATFSGKCVGKDVKLLQNGHPYLTDTEVWVGTWLNEVGRDISILYIK